MQKDTLPNKHVAKVPGMTLVERLRYPLIACEMDQTFLDAEQALRNAAADRIEQLENRKKSS